MLRVTHLVGLASEPAMADRLHDLAHHGVVETVHLSRGDMSRRRQQLTSDHGTEIALLLDRDANLQNGSVLWLDAGRAVVVALDEPQWLVLRTGSAARALELGYFAGNMHWKVRFDGEALCIAMEGPRSGYLDRMAHLLGKGDVGIDPEPAQAVNGHAHSTRRAMHTITTAMPMDRATLAPDAAPQASSLLAILQFADSFFPSGASAFSWGLESMNKDGLVHGAPQVLSMLTAIIEGRWTGFDRGLMRAAHHAAARLDSEGGRTPDFGELIRIDELCECMSLNQEGRAASRRLGMTQLKVHAGLGLWAAIAYLSEVQAQRAPGHLPVAHGLICHALGLSTMEGEAMSAFGQCTAVVGAAIRLGMLGHVDGQRLLMQMRGRIATVLATEPPELDDLWNGAPALEVAAMRHETRTARLFAN